MDVSKIDVEINPDYTMLKKVNKKLYLAQEQMDILDEYEINYRDCNSLSDLILTIERNILDSEDDVLFNLLDVLSERNYYENFKK